MKRRTFLKNVGVGFAALSLPGRYVFAKKSTKPNVQPERKPARVCKTASRSTQFNADGQYTNAKSG